MLPCILSIQEITKGYLTCIPITQKGVHRREIGIQPI